MTRLRRPRAPKASAGHVARVSSVTVPPPALALVGGAVCDGCRWPDRCGRDRLCWAAEKAAIAAEKAQP